PNSRQGKSNKRAGINENLAREILELHTLSIDGGYSQADIIEFAKALTGWRVAGLNPWPKAEPPGAAKFHTAFHEPGTRTIMTRRFPPGQEVQGKNIIKWLANHSETAGHIARKLAVHFISDAPPPSAVSKLKTVFLSTRGNLKSLYETLLEMEETWAPDIRKFKTPWEWAISMFRYVGAQLGPNFSTIEMCEQLGQPLWQPGSPAGWPDVAEDWATADNMVRRINFAYTFTNHMFAAAGQNRPPAKRTFGLDLVFTEATRPTSFSSKEADDLMLYFMSPEFLYR
ncbi:MAG: DUF1800 family protein, partial [Pseudomonadota bacterium]